MGFFNNVQKATSVSIYESQIKPRLKEKVTKRINKLKDRMNFYEEIRIGNEKSGEYTINTIKPRNSNIFETAIMLTELGEWHIVEEYKTKEDAIKGHKKYCSMAVNELDKII